MKNNMNRNILIAAVVIVVLGAGLWVFFSPKMSTDQTTKPTETTTNTTSTSNTSPNTFKSILAQSGSYECRYEQATSTGQSTNLIYISDGKLRGEFRTLGAVGNMMVYDGANLYVWMEGAIVGTKTQLKSLSELPLVIPKDLTSGSVLGSGIDNVSWDCHAWSKNAALLVPPKEVKFSAK